MENLMQTTTETTDISAHCQTKFECLKRAVSYKSLTTKWSVAEETGYNYRFLSSQFHVFLLLSNSVTAYKLVNHEVDT